MKIYIWEMFAGAPYEDSNSSATLFTSEAEAAQDIRDYMDQRRDIVSDEAPLPPNGLDAQAIIKWAKEQPDWSDEAHHWAFRIWDTDKTSNIVVGGW